GRSGHRRVARPSSLPAPPPNALFAEMLRASRELLAVRSPLDAELMVSELLGTWWGEREPGSGARNADLEEVIGEGLVAYAGQHASPAALALLSGIACLGTPRQAAAAECAALGLIERGIKRPGWAQHVGAVAAGDCYLNSDAFGDRDEAVCLFSYAGTEPHALVLVVDYNSAGMLSDGWVTSQVDTLLERCRDGSGRGTFRQVAASQARHLLETALGVTHAAPDPRVSKTFASYHPFIRSRIRALPPPDKASPARPPARGPAAGHPRARVGRGRRPGAAAGVEQRQKGDARGRVPRLRRGRGPVRPPGGQPVRRPHHQLRMRSGLRPAAADEPRQGGDVPARLAAPQDHALARRAACHAARARRLGTLGRAAPRAGR